MLRQWLLAVLLTAFVLRAAAVWHWRDELSNDRDGYLAIAANLRDGRGFSSDGTQPTAFRPPLYPLLLAAITAAGREWGVAAAQVLLGIGTVWLTFRIGRNLGMERGAIAAAGLVAIDPLLLRYTPQLMTETVFTFLVALLCCGCTGISNPDASSVRVAGPRRPKPGHRGAVLVGLAFGLCALCRPTIWAFGVLGGIIWIVGWRSSLRNRKRLLAEGLIAAGFCLLVVSPWVVRNCGVFGRPIVMTTHGGYTLLLGNNPVFYDEVVRKPWGTVWPRDSLRRWQESLAAEIRAANSPPLTELERDRWHRQRALDNMRNDPAGFAAACWLRFRRFWNIAPSGEGGELPAAVRWTVTAFYSLITVGLLAGVFRLRKSEWRRGWPLAVLLVSFTAVHLVYWTNTRMRAPLIPVIAVLCIRGMARNPSQESSSKDLCERGNGVMG